MKHLFKILTVFVITFLLSTSPVHATEPIIGAIRWDAWHGAKSIVGTTVEKQLSPQKWHYRVPFFGKIISSDKVEIAGYSQSIIDQEIIYAKRAGIDYWAFTLYDPSDAMSEALNLYLTSSRVNDVKFSFIVGPSIFQSDPARLIALMQKPSYQKVLGSRPLVYIAFLNDAWINSWGTNKGEGMIGARVRVNEFRAMAQAAGLGNPYIVIMRFWESVAKEQYYTDGLGTDAVSRYLVGGRIENGTFATLVSEAERLWDVDKSSGKNVVPLITTGLDDRPKVEIPNPWDTPRPIEDVAYFYGRPTLTELTQHVGHAVSWVQNNISSAPAQTALIYAWNENAEGGWIVPTLSEGTARIDALAPLLGGLTTSVADLDSNGKVTIIDYVLFISGWWLKTFITTDLNHDGKISVIDYTIFMNEWHNSLRR